jgi:hypothetical protein
MHSSGPFILILEAVLAAVFLLLVAAVLVLLVRKLVTGRPVWKQPRDWLLYLLIAPVMIAAFSGIYFYAASKGFDEHTIVKWMNILLSGVFVFGSTVKKFWDFRREWTFWAGLSVIAVSHFALLSRLGWEQASYFWLIVVVGIPELVLVFFLLGLMFNPKQRRTAEQMADIIERFLNKNRPYSQEWNDFVESREADSRLDVYRKRCDELDPLVNCPGPQNPQAVAELRSMIDQLRRQEVRIERDKSSESPQQEH